MCLNKLVLVTFAAGAILGLVYWFHFGCYWGTYPLSSEWWVNGIYGGILANLFREFIIS
ncbi:DUF6132 family protein [Bacteroides sp. OttesenSCG-928-E20]|nr:DUF6132 family protein [Bacteroides sp. OttesenSCG-928-E20]